MKLIVTSLTDPTPIVTQYSNDIITRLIDASIHTINLISLKGIYNQQPEEDRLAHLMRLIHIDDEDFKALSIYQKDTQCRT